MLHDFGTVLPNQVLRHRFPLTNPTATTWTLAKLIPSCSCTVASATAQAIGPGKTEFVEVEYKSPPTNLDDRRKVGVQFAEAGSPTFWLEIQARTRQPISFFPEILALNLIGRDGAESFFEIYNYSSKPIALEPPSSGEAWLKASLTEVKSRPPGVLQVWRVVVKASIAGLKPGVHRGEVVVAAPASDFRKSVPITLELVAPVRPIPSRLFFGSLERGKAVERKVSLLLSADLADLPPDQVIIDHDLGDQLRVDCSRSSPTRLELTATLTPGATGDPEIGGLVRVRFKDASLPPISLPLIATVSP